MSRKSHNTYEDVNFNTYIYRVLKQVHPDTGMSGDGLSEMNNLIRITLRKIVSAVNQLMMCSKGKKTISSREIQSAVRLALPGELSKHAVQEGTKAVTKYNVNPPGQKGNPISRGQRAGLQFPVTRVETIMMELATVNRKGSGAAIYLTACLEYICAELLEIGGNAARDHKKVRITPRHLKLAILNDSELSTLFKGVVMTGGVLPSIHTRLLPKMKPTKEEGEAPREKPRKRTNKKSTKNVKSKSPRKASPTQKTPQKTKKPSKAKASKSKASKAKKSRS